MMVNHMIFSDFVLLNPKTSLIKGLEYPFVEMEAIRPGRSYVYARNKRIYEGGGSKFQAGDTLFARITPCLENGKIAEFKGMSNSVGFGSTEFFIFRNREGISDSRYILYLALSDLIRKPAEKSMSGASGRQRADLASIKDLEVPAPPLPIQHKIAAILSAYDDLIENNTRRIAILEEMAQSLYREWFVHFRFPGHEKKCMVESALGMIPEGWEVVRLGEIAEVNKNSIKRGHEPDEIEYVDIASVSIGQIDHIETTAFTDAPGRARRIVKHGDIIWSTVRPNRRSYSIVLNPPVNMIVSTGFAVISSRRIPYTYLYYSVITDDFVNYLVGRATGSAYPAVSSGDFQNALILLPADELLSKFHEVIADLLDEKQNLFQRNANLRQTRDLLLPKLISGEVDVEGLEIAGAEETEEVETKAVEV
jgi:type I restriction enzyme S subunit